MGYNRMTQLHDYIYSTPADSPERERRLNELSDIDQAALWDYKQGLLSGRIKNSDYQMEADNMLTFKEWKKIENSGSLRDMNKVIDFKTQYPLIASEYQRHKEAEELKRREIMDIKDMNERLDAIARNLALFE